jgi:hypothetical protein
VNVDTYLRTTEGNKTEITVKQSVTYSAKNNKTALKQNKNSDNMSKLLLEKPFADIVRTPKKQKSENKLNNKKFTCSCICFGSLDEDSLHRSHRVERCSICNSSLYKHVHSDGSGCTKGLLALAERPVKCCMVISPKFVNRYSIKQSANLSIY